MSTAVKRKLRFAIMCNDLQLKQWQHDVITHLVNSGIAEPVLLITNSHNEKNTSLTKKILNYPYSKFLWNRYLRKLSRTPMQQLTALPEYLKKTEILNCTVIKKGYSEYFSDTDVAKIKFLDIDFMLRFGFNIIRGEILNAARYGIWSYHHDDEQKYRGGPFGFWEIYKNAYVNGVILQRLTEKLDAGIVLKKYFFKTTLHSFKEHTNNLLCNSTEMPLQVCRDILNNCSEYFLKEPTVTKAPIYKAPRNFVLFIFLVKLFRNRLLFHYKELFRSEKWFIGISKKPIKEIIFNNIDPEFEFIKPLKKSEFYADSFIYNENGVAKIIFEDYNYKTKKGVIASIPVNDFAQAEIMLSEETHLAYPFIFHEARNTYCIPEESEINRIALYKLNEINHCFEFQKILIENIDAVDSTLFKYSDCFWLFFTRKSAGTNSKLFAYYSQSLAGPYLEHHNNPIKVDIRSSRPAGTPFLMDGDLYRPAQNSAKHYGSRISINKIVKLTPDEFFEELVSEIRPEKYSKKYCGTHTVAVSESFIVIDFKKHGFIFQSFKNQFSRKFRKIRSK